MTKHIELLPQSEWPAELAEIAADLGRPLNVYGVLAHHPDLLKAWWPFRTHIQSGTTLSPRERELVILRTAHRLAVAYEWRHHVERGRKAGLGGGEITAVIEGPTAAAWEQRDAALLQAVDDIHDNTRIAPATLDLLFAHFEISQVLDLISTVGMYITLAVVLETFDVPHEDD